MAKGLLEEYREHLPKIVGAVVVILGFTLVTLLIMQLLGGAERLRSLIESAGIWAPLVYIGIKASTYIIAPLSGGPIVMASGAVFGVWEGMLFSAIGDTVGAVSNYWIARTLGRKGVSLFAGKKAMTKVDELAARGGSWPMLLGARLLLSAVYDFVSYAAGLARFPFGHFLWVSFVGGFPSNLTTAFLGHASTQSTRVMQLVIAVSGVLLVVFALTHVVQRRRKRQAPTPVVTEES